MIRAPPPTAAAICTIWRWPMASLPNSRVTSSSVPVSASIVSARPAHRLAIDDPAARRQSDSVEVLGDAEVVAERELLVHHPDAGGERVARADEVRSVPLISRRPPSGRWIPAMILPSVLFPAPFSPHNSVAGARRDLERDVGERLRTRETAC
jgi:hypothetical protein